MNLTKRQVMKLSRAVVALEIVCEQLESADAMLWDINPRDQHGTSDDLFPKERDTIVETLESLISIRDRLQKIELSSTAEGNDT